MKKLFGIDPHEVPERLVAMMRRYVVGIDRSSAGRPRTSLAWHTRPRQAHFATGRASMMVSDVQS